MSMCASSYSGGQQVDQLTLGIRNPRLMYALFTVYYCPDLFLRVSHSNAHVNVSADLRAARQKASPRRPR
jgi:hypothetical protein